MPLMRCILQSTILVAHLINLINIGFYVVTSKESIEILLIEFSSKAGIIDT